MFSESYAVSLKWHSRCGFYNYDDRQKWLAGDSLFLPDYVRSKPSNAPIRRQHTKRNIVVKDGQVRNDLLLERQSTRYPDEFALRQEAIVEAHAPPDAISGLGESQPRYDHQVDQIGRDWV